MQQFVGDSTVYRTKKAPLPDRVFYYFYHLDERDLGDFEEYWLELSQYDLSPKEISNILHKVAKELKFLKRDHSQLDMVKKTENILSKNFGVWENLALEKINQFNAQNLSTALWAYATLGIEPSQKFMQAWEKRAETLLSSSRTEGLFNSKDLSTTLWAYAALGIEPSQKFMTRWKNRARVLLNSRKREDRFKEQALTNSMWAFGAIDAFSGQDLLCLYNLFRPYIPANLSPISQKQIRDADLWFTDKSPLNNVTYRDKSTRSKLELRLKKAFKNAGYGVEVTNPLIPEFPQGIDFPVGKKGKEFWKEVDGPPHYVRNWKTGEVRLNGQTMYRSALLQKFAPDERIVRIGCQRAEEFDNNPDALHGLFQHFVNREPGLYLIPEPNQVGGGDQNFRVIRAKRPLQSRVLAA